MPKSQNKSKKPDKHDKHDKQDNPPHIPLENLVLKPQYANSFWDKYTDNLVNDLLKSSKHGKK